MIVKKIDSESVFSNEVLGLGSGEFGNRAKVCRVIKSYSIEALDLLVGI